MFVMTKSMNNIIIANDEDLIVDFIEDIIVQDQSSITTVCTETWILDYVMYRKTVKLISV